MVNAMPPVKDGHQRRRLLVPATWLLRRARAHADNSSPLDLGVGHRLVVLLFPFPIAFTISYMCIGSYLFSP